MTAAIFEIFQAQRNRSFLYDSQKTVFKSQFLSRREGEWMVASSAWACGPWILRLILSVCVLVVVGGADDGALQPGKSVKAALQHYSAILEDDLRNAAAYNHLSSALRFSGMLEECADVMIKVCAIIVIIRCSTAFAMLKIRTVLHPSSACSHEGLALFLVKIWECVCARTSQGHALLYPFKTLYPPEYPYASARNVHPLMCPVALNLHMVALNLHMIWLSPFLKDFVFCEI